MCIYKLIIWVMPQEKRLKQLVQIALTLPCIICTDWLHCFPSSMWISHNINPIALRTVKTLWSFGRSECSRVNCRCKSMHCFLLDSCSCLQHDSCIADTKNEIYLSHDSYIFDANTETILMYDL